METTLKETFIKIMYSIIITVIGLIPLWIFLLIFFLLEPQGFWQNIITYGVGIYFLGGIQFILLFFIIFLIFKLWVDL